MHDSSSRGAALRLASLADAERIAAIYAPYVRATAVSFEEAPPDAEELRARIAGPLVRVPWLVAERRGEVAGYAYTNVFRTRAAYRWSIESSVYVDAAHHRAGVARALMKAVIDLARLGGYRTLIAGVTLPGAASIALHEALGFEPIGLFPRVGHKFGAWHGVGFWTLDLALDGAATAPHEPPREPLIEWPAEVLARVLREHAGGIAL